MKISLSSLFARGQSVQTAKSVAPSKRFGVMDMDIEDIQKSTLSPAQRAAFMNPPLKVKDKLSAIMNSDID